MHPKGCIFITQQTGSNRIHSVFYVMQTKDPYGLMAMEPLLKVEDLDVFFDQANKNNWKCCVCLP